MAITDERCRVCGQIGVTEVAGFAELARVTSDCKPFRLGGRLGICSSCGAVQKPVDAVWQTEAGEIYREYEPYHSSGGKEQAVFDPAKGAPRPRSAVVLDHLVRVSGLERVGAVLDVGCGNGALLSAFADLRPDWSLYGHDLSETNLAPLKAIPGFQRLHTGPLDRVAGRYDVVTMMHSLEHFVDPAEGLQDVKRLIKDDGCLLVEVPNAEATPFDLLIADHVCHFSRHDLARLLRDAGYRVLALADDWVTKELSAVAVPSSNLTASLPEARDPAAVMRQVAAQIDWLNAVIAGARGASVERGPFGVFGTSIAATWLYSTLEGAVDFFVDEDPNCQGRSLYDKPIFTPAEIPPGAITYVMLIPHVARAVASRLAALGHEMRVPPSIAA